MRFEIRPSLCVCVSVSEREFPGEAVSLLEQQDDSAARQTHDDSGLREQTLTYPSRLIYYLNEASESTFHDLNTRARTPDPNGQVRISSHLDSGDFFFREARLGNSSSVRHVNVRPR